jgi:hypothetical protein
MADGGWRYGGHFFFHPEIDGTEIFCLIKKMGLRVFNGGQNFFPKKRWGFPLKRWADTLFSIDRWRAIKLDFPPVEME